MSILSLSKNSKNVSGPSVRIGLSAVSLLGRKPIHHHSLSCPSTQPVKLISLFSNPFKTFVPFGVAKVLNFSELPNVKPNKFKVFFQPLFLLILYKRKALRRFLVFQFLIPFLLSDRVAKVSFSFQTSNS